MMSRRTRLISGILLVLYLGVVCFLCFAQLDDLPKVGRTLFGLELDKVVHFLMFLPMAPLIYFTYGRVIPGFWRSLGVTLVMFVIGCVIAAGTELGQGLTKYRTQDPKDFLADAYALGAGTLISFLINLILCHRKS